MPFVDPPASWSQPSTTQFVTHATPPTPPQRTNEARLASQLAAQNARRIFSESTHGSISTDAPVVPGVTGAWGASWDAWGTSWG